MRINGRSACLSTVRMQVHVSEFTTSPHICAYNCTSEAIAVAPILCNLWERACGPVYRRSRGHRTPPYIGSRSGVGRLRENSREFSRYYSPAGMSYDRFCPYAEYSIRSTLRRILRIWNIRRDTPVLVYRNGVVLNSSQSCTTAANCLRIVNLLRFYIELNI